MLRLGERRLRILLTIGSALAISSMARGSGPGGVPEEPPDPIRAYLSRTKELERNGSTTLVRGFDSFANLPPGTFGVEGVPLVLFRLLPDLAIRLGDHDPEVPDRPLFGNLD